MKKIDLEQAKAIRDGAIDAMDALDWSLGVVEMSLTDEQRPGLRMAVAHAMDGILTNLVNPIIKNHPELEADEDSWGEVAVAQTRARLDARVAAAGEPPAPPAPTPDFAELLKARGVDLKKKDPKDPEPNDPERKDPEPDDPEPQQPNDPEPG